jgi:hypothetical protein
VQETLLCWDHSQCFLQDHKAIVRRVVQLAIRVSYPNAEENE